ncbi:MAG: tetratricopeptide repeat protein [Opitutaceae bacterium]|nr:tetratricopeptide repeat protein [Opitutaceae bacterium]
MTQPAPKPDFRGTLLFVAAIAAYLPALSAGFIWDDQPGHVTRPDLRSLAGLARIWFEPGATQQFYPLLHSAFWLEHTIWGDAAFGYHLVNVLLHATAALLFARVLLRLAVPGAWLAAALFALHPVGVESVAWISEQKNTLSTVLYLCAALAWLRFDAAAPAQPRSARLYAIATALFIAALLTKTVTATLPAALLVIAWWRHGRIEFRRDVVPLLPWFALGIGAGLFTAWVEHAHIGAQGADFALGPIERVLLAGRAMWFYAASLVWPFGLSFIYPRWTIDAGVVWQWLFPLAAVALLAGFWLHRGKNRGPLAAALLFGGTLVPALGFVNVFPFRYSYVADHFQYLASLAAFALAGAGLVRLPPKIGRAAAALVLTGCAVLTWRHAAVFKDQPTLWAAVLERDPDSWIAHNNLGLALVEAGTADEALTHLKRARALRPDFAESANNLGDALNRLGRATEAIEHLAAAIRLQPKFAEAHNNLGVSLMATNRSADGIARFAEAARLQPGYALAHRNLGLAYLNTNRAAEALGPLTRATELQPDYAQAHTERGIALTELKRPAEAITPFATALKLDPTLVNAHYGLALALRALGRNAEAEPHEREAQRLRSGSAPPGR